MSEGIGELVAPRAQTNVGGVARGTRGRVDDDPQVAAAKRAVDRLNQQRNAVRDARGEAAVG